MIALTIDAKIKKKFKGYKFGEACTVHLHNSYVPLEDHHIHPKEYHGLDVKSNLTRICSNGHGETHYYLELLLATGEADMVEADNLIPSSIRRRFGPKVKSLARLGFMKIMNSKVTEKGLIPT